MSSGPRSGRARRPSVARLARDARDRLLRGPPPAGTRTPCSPPTAPRAPRARRRRRRRRRRTGSDSSSRLRRAPQCAALSPRRICPTSCASAAGSSPPASALRSGGTRALHVLGEELGVLRLQQLLPSAPRPPLRGAAGAGASAAARVLVVVSGSRRSDFAELAPLVGRRAGGVHPRDPSRCRAAARAGLWRTATAVHKQSHFPARLCESELRPFLACAARAPSLARPAAPIAARPTPEPCSARCRAAPHQRRVQAGPALHADKVGPLANPWRCTRTTIPFCPPADSRTAARPRDEREDLGPLLKGDRRRSNTACASRRTPHKSLCSSTSRRRWPTASRRRSSTTTTSR